jgi:hypothetical protein
MKRIMLLAGLVTLLAAGTASAQTSVQLSFGFGVPRPYVSGDVFVGRPHWRPVYRPFFYRPYSFGYFRGTRRLIIVERRHQRFDRDRDFDRDRGRDRDRNRGRDRDRDRD